jgi:Ni,Fe-hydrogenase I cytochrome b subunit
MAYFYVYLIFFLMFSAFTLYYLVQKSRGCAGSRPVHKEAEETSHCCQVHYFDQVLVYIILELFSRMAFLSTGFVAFYKDNPQAVKYEA